MFCTLLITTYFTGNTQNLINLLDKSVKLDADILFQAMRNRCDYLPDGYTITDRFKPIVKKTGTLDSLEVLISKGEFAIPYLISQLSNDQPSNLVLGSDFVKYIEYEAYDSKARQKTGNAWPAVETNDLLIDSKGPARHTISRGDIAFFVIGQIVNRWYGVIRSYPGVIFYCPIAKNSMIQKQVKSDWLGISSESLRKSLEIDSLHPDSLSRQIFGFQRYRCQFPKSVNSLAVKCLRHSYGKASDIEPKAGPFSLISQFAPIASGQIDVDLHRMIQSDKLFDKTRKEYQFTELEILYYLVARDGYHQFALSFAQKVIASGGDSSGLYRIFLIESKKANK